MVSVAFAAAEEEVLHDTAPLGVRPPPPPPQHGERRVDGWGGIMMAFRMKSRRFHYNGCFSGEEAAAAARCGGMLIQSLQRNLVAPSQHLIY